MFDQILKLQNEKKKSNLPNQNEKTKVNFKPRVIWWNRKKNVYLLGERTLLSTKFYNKGYLIN